MSISFPNLKQQRSERDSNMEMLRIVAMSMIIIHHFIRHVIYPEDPDSIYRIIAPFFQCGVNLFFLISGYFTIRLSVRSLVRLVLFVATFGLISNVLCVACGGTVSYKSWASFVLFPVSKNYYWFIQAYFGLMLLSPVINKGLESLSSHNLRVFTLLFTVFTVYSCAIGQNICNNTGYTFCQGLYCYCLAHWIRVDAHRFSRVKNWKYLLTAFIITCLSSVLYWKTNLYFIPAYNSIFTVAVSALIFIYFCNVSFKSRAVNQIATAALGCYLLQDGTLGNQIIYEWQHNFVYGAHPLADKLILFTISFISFWIVSFFITKLLAAIYNAIIKSIPEKWLSEIRF